MNAMPKHQLEVVAYHERLPGHHMQIAIAQEEEFHDTVLGGGALPLGILERRVNDWVAGRKAS